MDKIKVNNQIIAMRKLVKQGKIHIINRLVKEVKLLKAKKGSEAQIAKYQRKAERLLSEISIIKKINVDSVSKMCLCNEEDWKNKISDSNVSLEDRAMARLANFEAVQKEVILFKAEFPHLARVLPDLIQQWEQKKQQQPHNEKKLTASEIKKRKKEKHLKLKEKKAAKELPKVFVSDSQSANELKFKIENNEDFHEDSNMKIQNSCNDNFPEKDFVVTKDSPEKNCGIDEDSDNGDVLNDAEILGNEIKEPHDSNTIARVSEQSSDEVCSSNEYENEVKSTDEEEEADSDGEHISNMADINKSGNSLLRKSINKTSFKSKKVVKTKIPVISHGFLSKQTHHLEKAKNAGLKEIKPLNLEDLKEFDVIPVDQKDSMEKDETMSVSTGKEKRDPFFLQSNDESDGDDCEDNDANNASSEDDLVSQNKRSYVQNRRVKSIGNGVKGFCASKDSKRFGRKNVTVNQSSRFDRPGRNFKNQFFKSSQSYKNAHNKFVKNESKFHSSLHLSKEQQNFHGSKRNSNFGNKYARKGDQMVPNFNVENKSAKFSGKMKPFLSDGKKEVHLHPSWEAKRKQNAMSMSIVPFQGKKIKFED